MWPFRKPPAPKLTHDVRVRLTDDETLACAQLLDAYYAKPRNRDHYTGALLWQWVERTLGDRYIHGCRVRIETDNKSNFYIVFLDVPKS